VDREGYLTFTVENGGMIARAVQASPDQPVPSCPEWRLRDLGFHVGCIMRLWADVVRRASLERRPLGFGVERPPDSELELFLRSEVAAAVEVLADASDDTPAWNWWGDSTARAIPRVLAHETAVHGWDAMNALGLPASIPPALAADGVVEFFDIWIPYTGHPPGGLAGSLALEATDVGIRWLVDIAEATLPSITATDTTAGAGAAVRGIASELQLLLWRRLAPDALTIFGDREFVDRFLEYPKGGVTREQ
jgi:uncharacterized protein (TIGR03083 family)